MGQVHWKLCESAAWMLELPTPPGPEPNPGRITVPGAKQPAAKFSRSFCLKRLRETKWPWIRAAQGREFLGPQQRQPREREALSQGYPEARQTAEAPPCACPWGLSARRFHSHHLPPYSCSSGPEGAGQRGQESSRGLEMSSDLLTTTGLARTGPAGGTQRPAFWANVWLLQPASSPAQGQPSPGKTIQ